MVDIAFHVRIFEADPTDDTVDKRKKAIDEITKKFASRKQLAKIFQLASDISRWAQDSQSMPEPLATEIEDCLKGASSSFVRDGKGIEMITCALLAAAQLIEKAKPEAGGASKVGYFAAALWSALSFQPPRPEAKLEKLRQELIGLARRFSTDLGRACRQRIEVGDLEIDVPDGEVADFAALVENIKEGANVIISELDENAELDREEIDVLWWALGEWSETLNCRLSSITSEVAAVVGGIELASRLKGFPCDAHKHLVLRNVRPSEHLLTLEEVVSRVQVHGDVLLQGLSRLPISGGYDQMFPLITALSKDMVQLPGCEIRRPTDEWGARALFEAAVIRLAAESGGD